MCGAARGNLRSSVIAKGRPVPLIHYGAKAVGKGVSVKVKARTVITHAFIATVPNGTPASIYASAQSMKRQ